MSDKHSTGLNLSRLNQEQVDSIDSKAYASLTSGRTHEIVINMFQISFDEIPFLTGKGTTTQVQKQFTWV
jgi:hypothetical protein